MRAFKKTTIAFGFSQLVTLFDEDDGYGMIIKTTGRNLRETQAIADILKEMY